MIDQITIIGTGLIGGSFALALKSRGFSGRIVGCDRPDVLRKARELGAIDLCEEEPLRATEGSQLIMLSTPVMTIFDMLSRITPKIPEGVLITDTGSTKAAVVQHAKQVLRENSSSRFLPGHPIAGKERGGIEEADADLFSGATWVLTPQTGVAAIVSPEFTRGVHGEFMGLLESIGARVVVLDPDRHDRVCAYTSHLPQMLSTALAATIVNEAGSDAALPALAGPGLRDMTRLSQSDYSMWRDVALSNTKNLQDALLKFEQELAHIRENLKTRELKAEFDRAHELDLDTPPEERASDDSEPPLF